MRADPGPTFPVRTTEEAEIEMHRMQVEAVESTGQACPGEGGSSNGTSVPQEP